MEFCARLAAEFFPVERIVCPFTSIVLYMRFNPDDICLTVGIFITLSKKILLKNNFAGLRPEIRKPARMTLFVPRTCRENFCRRIFVERAEKIFMKNKLALILIVSIVLFSIGFFFNREENFFVPKTFPQFRTVDLSGEVVTNEIFSGKITVVFLWTTTGEVSTDVLKKLDAEEKNLSPEFQIVGLVGDVKSDAAPEKIFAAKKFSKNIRQLTVNDDFAPLLTKIKSVPTVIFTDEHGNLIGLPKPVTDAKFIFDELRRISEKDSPINRLRDKIHDKIFRADFFGEIVIQKSP